MSYTSLRSVSKRSLLLSLLLAASSAFAGCSVDADESPEVTAAPTQAALDQLALVNALENQGRLVAEGYVLEGRLWYAPDSHVAFYRAASGEVMQYEMGRATAERVAAAEKWRPTPGQNFQDYLDTLEQYQKLSGTSEGADVITFEPSTMSASDVGEVSQALTNENCDKVTFDAQCNNPTRYSGGSHIQPTTRWDRAVETWYLTDQATVAATLHNNRSTNGSNVVCADKGSARLTQTFRLESSWGSTPGGLDIVINQGSWLRYSYAGGNQQANHCLNWAPLFCADWETEMKFMQFKTTIGVTATGSGANYHFCGYLGKIDDYRVSDSKSHWVFNPAASPL